MAPSSGLHLTALCAVGSFFWLSSSFDRHTLSDKPRLSSIWIFLIAGLVAFAASFFSTWLPGANGRFDDDYAPLKSTLKTGTSQHLARRPRRFFLPLLVICIAGRLELFHRISLDQQCSTPGLESFLPLLLVLYEAYSACRKKQPLHDGHDDHEDDDMSATLFDDLASFWSRYSLSLCFSVLILTSGTYMSTSSRLRSTVYCPSSLDQGSLIVMLQQLSLLLDAAIVVLLWRILSWVRTTKDRLRMLSGILVLASLTIGLVYVGSWLGLNQTEGQGSSTDSLYLFDLLVDGLAFAALFVSGTLTMCETSPSLPTTMVAFAMGFLAILRKVYAAGTFEQTSRAEAIVPLWLICVGFVWYLFAKEMRSVLFVHRILIVIGLLFVLATATSTGILINSLPKMHPIEKIIFDTRVETDRWLVHASVSKSIRIAVEEYQERHHGHNPPGNFDKWFEFAREHNSVIIDQWQQIEKDIAPFWGVPPKTIRRNVEAVVSEPNMGVISIKSGTVSHNEPSNADHRAILDGAVGMILNFAKHLPDMDLPINLDDRPRVITPWSEIRRRRFSETSKGAVMNMLPGRSLEAGDILDEARVREDAVPSSAEQDYTSAQAFRNMAASACPPGSRSRSGKYWNIRDFCASCANPQSSGSFITNWKLSEDLCHQPDITRLHGFYMNPPQPKVMDHLVPVFSRAKPNGFNDILMPLPRPHENRKPDPFAGFQSKRERLYWRGNVTRPALSYESLHGGHQERLVHLVNNASAADEISLLLAPRKNTWAYETVPTAAANDAISFDVGITAFPGCEGQEKDTDGGTGGGGGDGGGGGGGSGICGAARRELGTSPTSSSSSSSTDGMVNSRFVLVMDTDTDGAPELQSVLRSHSVPLVATVFHEWFSERLVPWLHFVPVDLRFHSLHSTLAYFAGLKGGKAHGRELALGSRGNDAVWIADQGTRWMEKAVRREDAEIYLFRLLLEWGRVIDDRRDEIGFVLD